MRCHFLILLEPLNVKIYVHIGLTPLEVLSEFKDILGLSFSRAVFCASHLPAAWKRRSDIHTCHILSYRVAMNKFIHSFTSSSDSITVNIVAQRGPRSMAIALRPTTRPTRVVVCHLMLGLSANASGASSEAPRSTSGRRRPGRDNREG